MPTATDPPPPATTPSSAPASPAWPAPARWLQAGHRVTVFEKRGRRRRPHGQRDTPFGSFDNGAQYFTVRDPRFEQALATTPAVCKPWSANAVRVLDPHGRVAEAALPAREPHWVAQPGMDALVAALGAAAAATALRDCAPR